MLGFAPLATEPASSQPLQGAATLSAVSTLVAGANLQASGVAALVGTATIEAFLGRVQQASASLTARATVIADIDVTYASAALTLSTATLTVGRTIPIRGGSAAIAASARLDVFTTSLFEDLVSNPNRRRIYAIEIEPALLVPYEDVAA